MARKKQKKDTCTFNHHMALEISQSEARCIAMGNFLPRTVADKMIADIEALYARTADRERVAKLVDPTLGGLAVNDPNPWATSASTLRLAKIALRYPRVLRMVQRYVDNKHLAARYVAKALGRDALYENIVREAFARRHDHKRRRA